MKKNIVKKIIILVLLLAAAAAVCVSCAKKEEKETKKEMVSFTVVNSTGTNVTEIAMEDRRSESKMSAKPSGGDWEDGASVGFSMMAAIEDNAPDLMFTFTVEGGSSLTTMIDRKEGTITLVNGADGLSIDITDP